MLLTKNTIVRNNRVYLTKDNIDDILNEDNWRELRFEHHPTYRESKNFFIDSYYHYCHNNYGDGYQLFRMETTKFHSLVFKSMNDLKKYLYIQLSK